MREGFLHSSIASANRIERQQSNARETTIFICSHNLNFELYDHCCIVTRFRTEARQSCLFAQRPSINNLSVLEQRFPVRLFQHLVK